MNGKFTGGGRFTLALKADEHDDGRGRFSMAQGLVLLPHQLDQFAVDELNDLLAGVDALQHLLPDGRLLHIRDEAFDHLEIDIRLEQRQADLLQRVFHVLLCQTALTSNVLEDVLELL